MGNDNTPLTDAERAELEQLRAEKQAREDAERARRERAELERLRAERAQSQSVASAGAAQDKRIQESRERGRKLMEPDDDLSMPLGQKLVLVGIAIAVVAIVALLMFGPKS